MSVFPGTPRSSILLALCGAWLAASVHAQSSPGTTDLFTLPARLPGLEASLLGAAPFDDEEVKPSYDFGSFGVRLGAFVFLDSDKNDLFGVLPLVGADLKYHLPDTILAGQTSLDFSFGNGSMSGGGQSIDSDVLNVAWRLSIIFEPPPGSLGTKDGSFYVNPYAGGGIGLHYSTFDTTSKVAGATGSSSTTDSNSTMGFHVVFGVEFVFRLDDMRLSIGGEGLWATTDPSDVGGNDDYGGYGVAVSGKIYF